MKMKDFIKHLKTYDPETEIVPVFWQKDDVLHRAKERNELLTDEQASQIVEALEGNHDACIGISWDIIDYYLDDLDLPEKGEVT